jgi:hypothetical protein
VETVAAPVRQQRRVKYVACAMRHVTRPRSAAYESIHAGAEIRKACHDIIVIDDVVMLLLLLLMMMMLVRCS